MEGDISTKIKEEPLDDIFEYRGAPSPETPIYGLTPLQNSSPNASRQPTFKNENVNANDNFLINMEQLENQYSFSRKGNQPDVLETESDQLANNEASRCTESYFNSKKKSVRDAWSQTTFLPEDSYKTKYNMCAACKPENADSKFGQKIVIRFVRAKKENECQCEMKCEMKMFENVKEEIQNNENYDDFSMNQIPRAGFAQVKEEIECKCEMEMLENVKEEIQNNENFDDFSMNQIPWAGFAQVKEEIECKSEMEMLENVQEEIQNNENFDDISMNQNPPMED